MGVVLALQWRGSGERVKTFEHQLVKGPPDSFPAMKLGSQGWRVVHVVANSIYDWFFFLERETTKEEGPAPFTFGGIECNPEAIMRRHSLRHRLRISMNALTSPLITNQPTCEWGHL